ncbi:hypothetical protein [Erythrobacter sp. Alg231-14]|uniref:hypothetical protein n=1 Tax=Erythrobacter sp. Alg231-14 TaxID=1922225 RepID=UPI000D55A998
MLKHALAAAILFLSPVSASASTFNCFFPTAESGYAKSLTSDVIFVGELLDYELVDDLFIDEEHPSVVATFQVADTLKGEAPELVKVELGLMYNPTDEIGIPSGSVIVFGVARPTGSTAQDTPFYLKTYFCGRGAVLIGSEQNVEAIRSWLATGEVRAHEVSEGYRFGGPLTGSRPNDRFYWVLMAFIALGAATAIALTIRRLPKIA